jgi:uncharacterized protein YegP (UPF0339 family)
MTLKEEVNAVSKFQIYEDRKGEYRWRLRARNGEIIADSNEGYSRKANCKHGIDLVKEQAASAVVEDQTEEDQTERQAEEEHPGSEEPGSEEGLVEKAKRKLQGQ